MYHKKILLHIVITIICFGGNYTQILAQTYKIEHLKSIKKTAVHSLSLSSSNEMWAATTDSIYALLPDNTLQKSIPSGAYKLHCGNAPNNQNVWLALKTNIIRQLGSSYGFPINIKISETVNDILVGKTKIYVATTSGLFVINDKNNRKSTVRKFSSAQGVTNVNTLHEDANEKLWFGTQRGLFVLNNDTMPTFLKQMPISAIAHHQDIITVAGNKQLFEYQENTGKFKEIKIDPTIAPYRIENMTYDALGNLWIAGRTVAYYNIGGNWRIYTQTDGFDSKHALCITTDNEKNVWVGTEGKGVYKFSLISYLNLPNKIIDTTEPIAVAPPPAPPAQPVAAFVSFMETAPPANIVFLLDVSLSMNSMDKLPRLKLPLTEFAEMMRSTDNIAIVAFSKEAKILLPPTPCVDIGATLVELFDTLKVSGGTNFAGGLQLAYQTIEQNLNPTHNNRIIIVSDGAFIVNEATERLAAQKTTQNIRLSAIDFATPNYSLKLKSLSLIGQGNHFAVSKRGSLRNFIEKEIKNK
jgi:uncharacterized protein YegL